MNFPCSLNFARLGPGNEGERRAAPARYRACNIASWQLIPLFRRLFASSRSRGADLFPRREGPMRFVFKRRGIVSEFESLFENFKTVRVTGEVRVCPLSGHPTRLLPVRLKDFARTDWTPIINRSRELG